MDHAKKRKKDGGDGDGTHIRFDQAGDGSAGDAASTVAVASFHSSTSNTSDNPKQNKRKRKHPSPKTNKGDGNKIFNGLIIAISALESKQNTPTTTTNNSDIIDGKTDTTTITAKDKDNNLDINDDDPSSTFQNYKTLKQLLQSHGATLSPQVHKRVHYLVSTESAMQHLTQRVRQALKRNVDIIDVEWVKECCEKNTRVDVGNYMCNELVGCLMAEKEKEKRRENKKKNKKKVASNNNDNDDEEDGDTTNGKNKSDQCNSDNDNNAPSEEEDNAEGWSTPIQLDCCCVCHENGDDNCPWCTDCNLTLDRIAMKSNCAKACE